MVIDDVDDRGAAEAELARAAATVAGAGADVESLLRIAPGPGVGALRAAAERRASLLVVEYGDARAATDALRDEAGAEVLAVARTPVAILTAADAAPTRLLLALDDTAGPDLQTCRAVATAVAGELARAYGCPLEAVGGTVADTCRSAPAGSIVVIGRALRAGVLDARVEALRETGARLAIVLAPPDVAARRVLDTAT